MPAYRFRPCRPSALRCAASPSACRNLPTRSILFLLHPTQVAAVTTRCGFAMVPEPGGSANPYDGGSLSLRSHPPTPHDQLDGPHREIPGLNRRRGQLA